MKKIRSIARSLCLSVFLLVFLTAANAFADEILIEDIIFEEYTLQEEEADLLEEIFADAAPDNPVAAADTYIETEVSYDVAPLFEGEDGSDTRTLSVGMEGEDVLRLQTALYDKGYLIAAPDGWFGNYSLRAVKKFQMYHSLSITGIADKATMDLLYDEGSSGLYTLSIGSSGSAVYALQEQLFQLGYLMAAPDGAFGNYTYQAVLNFQKSNSISADGICGTITLEALFGDPVAYSGPLQPAVEGLTTGDSGKDVLILQERLTELGYLYVGADGWYGGFTQRAVPFTEIEQGSFGIPVYGLQELLAELGYLTAEPDGGFGSITKRAVVQFQRSNGLTADGSVGKYTLEVLLHDPQPFDPLTASDALAMQMTREVLDQIGWDIYKAFIYSVQLGEVFNGYLTDATTSEAVINGLYSPYVDCVRAASVFCYFARNMGYDAWVVSGVYLMTNGAYGNHAWCRIVVNGDTLNCDPTRGLKGYMFHYGDPGTLRYTEYEVLADY